LSEVIENAHINTTVLNINLVRVTERWDPTTRTLSYTFAEDFWNPLKHNTLKTAFEGEEVTCHEAMARGMVRRFQSLYNTGNFPEVL
jgi:hypothetical protein